MDAPLAKLVQARWQEALDATAFSADNSEAYKVWDKSADS